MKTSSLKKAIEKMGFKVMESQRPFRNILTGQMDNGRSEFYAQGNKYKVHWYDQEGSAICVQVQKIGDENDSQSDYFPGYFADTIKEIIRSLNEKN